jgi:hypothetical protein
MVEAEVERPCQVGQRGRLRSSFWARLNKKDWGSFKTEQSKGVLAARGQERRLLRLGPEVEEATG